MDLEEAYLKHAHKRLRLPGKWVHFDLQSWYQPGFRLGLHYFVALKTGQIGLKIELFFYMQPIWKLNF